MRYNFPFHFRKVDQDFSDLESELDVVLQPIVPDDDYVRALRKKLAYQWGLPRPTTTPDTRGVLMLIGAGFLSGIMILLFSIRAVLTIAATIGLLYQVKLQLDEKRSTSLPPAI